MTEGHNGGQWGGLNDTRNQEFSIGTAPSDYTGGILGTQENTRFNLSNGFQNHVLRYKYELQLAHYGNLCFGNG
jgi:opacity protein-like surface antigen